MASVQRLLVISFSTLVPSNFNRSGPTLIGELSGSFKSKVSKRYSYLALKETELMSGWASAYDLTLFVFKFKSQ